MLLIAVVATLGVCYLVVAAITILYTLNMRVPHSRTETALLLTTGTVVGMAGVVLLVISWAGACGYLTLT